METTERVQKPKARHKAIVVSGEEFQLLSSSEIVQKMDENHDLAIMTVDKQRCIVDRSLLSNYHSDKL
jgi:hypothetical protein